MGVKIRTNMLEYRHNILYGRIIINNDEMRAFVNKLDALIRSLPAADNIDNFKSTATKYGTLGIDEQLRYYGFFVNTSGRGTPWSFEFINKVFERFVNNDEALHPLTYVVSICDSTDKNECSCRAYGNVQAEYIPYSKENAIKMFNTDKPKFVSLHQMDIQITMPRDNWENILHTADCVALIREAKKSTKEGIKQRINIIHDLYNTFGICICPEGEKPEMTISNISCYDLAGVIDGFIGNDVTICLAPSELFSIDPDTVISAQKHASEIMQQYDGHIDYVFLFEADGILLPSSDIAPTCPAFIQYIRDEHHAIIDAQILHFAALSPSKYFDLARAKEAAIN